MKQTPYTRNTKRGISSARYRRDDHIDPESNDLELSDDDDHSSRDSPPRQRSYQRHHDGVCAPSSFLQGQDKGRRTQVKVRRRRHASESDGKDTGDATLGRRSLDDDDEEADETGNETDESAEPDIIMSTRYPGPALSTLSCQVIHEYLTECLRYNRLAIGTVDYLSRWWPKTNVQFQYKLDKAQLWLLTHSVTFWWSSLFERLNGPRYQWPDWLQDHHVRQSLKLRVEEIFYDKKKQSVRAEREMKEAGQSIPVDNVYQLTLRA